MASFRIWCRVGAISSQQYVATVMAIPVPAGEPSSHLESESRLVKSKAEAKEACGSMISSLEARLREGGHTIISADAGLWSVSGDGYE